MSDRSYRRLTRYALFAAASLPTVIVVMLSPISGYTALLVVVLSWVPFFLAIGPYQADVALNSYLDETGRRWWRIALFLLPWSMALYWYWYVRGAFVD